MSEWISIGDRLPPRQKKVLIIEKGGRCIVGYYGSSSGSYEGDDFWAALTGGYDSYPTTNVTHWMPLPEPPK